MFGSLFAMLFSLIVIIGNMKGYTEGNSAPLSNDDTLLTKVEYNTTWILMTLSGIHACHVCMCWLNQIVFFIYFFN